MKPVEIDDIRMKRRLTAELVSLADSGEAVPPAEFLRNVPAMWAGIDVRPAPSGLSTPAEIYRSACRSVVAVGKLYLCSRCGKRHSSIATGFAIAESGLVVTSFHVVDDDDKTAIGIMTFDGSVHPVKSVVAANRADDLAVLRVPTDDLVPLGLGAEPEVGAPVHVVSHPAGRLYTFTTGLVSRYSSHRRHGSRFRLMSVTADFGHGSSGGPVLDARGAVVGVARQTKSIYHGSGDDKPRRLQMVLKHATPADALEELGLRRAS